MTLLSFETDQNVAHRATNSAIPVHFRSCKHPPKLILGGRLAVSKLPIRRAPVIEVAVAQREETEKAAGEVPRCYWQSDPVSNSRATFRYNDWKPPLQVTTSWLSIWRNLPDYDGMLQPILQRAVGDISAFLRRIPLCLQRLSWSVFVAKEIATLLWFIEYSF